LTYFNYELQLLLAKSFTHINIDMSNMSRKSKKYQTKDSR